MVLPQQKSLLSPLLNPGFHPRHQILLVHRENTPEGFQVTSKMVVVTALHF
ncbi:Uncharacterised protein [Buttiauxella agrestis]|uniref:Uncharacterized protein n=1 Tax=Buttiauxella agrestis TaxID=82977 RepID=A0A381C4H9_9ENTR|nr:Uncharacterised protein [Buttiauxella agrestis]